MINFRPAGDNNRPISFLPPIDAAILRAGINLFSYNPSQIINIKPSYIKEKSKAEINIIDPNIEWTFSNEDIQSKSYNTPILGMKLKGKIIYTLNKGFISNNN